MVLLLLERLARTRRRNGGIWTALAFATFLLRWNHRRTLRDQVYLSEELRPGESLLVTHTAQRRG
jgi:hypothetical protein